ncbi:MAG: gfo/Idh/MocA family oxidoreductase [Candidatus Abyssobacteria bacterium SURF_17]|uniref:Gfo/Idh/MocA family oxidoreductase n=1 Tax=Candidatus Abyssobacteria bacterium SURF_17 TaxID=2093361 RepID=A0A419F7W6_9BACT|nr:MAG: gfo/Idh/MocA family oxidoreductase [Candidatus Abyssubacteria bacterium SURF_17]
MNRLKAGVVGVGHLGYHHARTYASHPNVKLVGVADIDRQRADEVAAEFGAKAFEDYRELAQLVDAMSVAVPTSKHFEVTSHLLKEKKHVLLEKPIATTLDEADELIRLSESSGVMLQIGHLERFNAAVRSLRDRLNKPMFIESHRLAPFTPRGCDVDVVLDLMIHDLDIILNILNSPVERVVDAVGVPLVSEHEDIANARLLFRNGCVANVTASRISAEPMRKIRIFQPYTYFSLDYAAQQITCYHLKKGPIDWTNPETLIIDSIPVEKDEPLKREIAAFAESVMSGRCPVVTGREARDALEVATRIIEVIRSKKYE